MDSFISMSTLDSREENLWVSKFITSLMFSVVYVSSDFQRWWVYWKMCCHTLGIFREWVLCDTMIKQDGWLFLWIGCCVCDWHLHPRSRSLAVILSTIPRYMSVGIVLNKYFSYINTLYYDITILFCSVGEQNKLLTLFVGSNKPRACISKNKNTVTKKLNKA